MRRATDHRIIEDTRRSKDPGCENFGDGHTGGALRLLASTAIDAKLLNKD